MTQEETNRVEDLERRIRELEGETARRLDILQRIVGEQRKKIDLLEKHL